MNGARNALRRLAIGTLCGVVLSGCSGNAIPTGPGNFQSPGGGATGATTTSVSGRQVVVGGISALESPGQENKTLICYDATGATTLFPIVAWGMPEAVEICHSQGGQVGGVKRLPPPPAP